MQAPTSLLANLVPPAWCSAVRYASPSSSLLSSEQIKNYTMSKSPPPQQLLFLSLLSPGRREHRQGSEYWGQPRGLQHDSQPHLPVFISCIVWLQNNYWNVLFVWSQHFLISPIYGHSSACAHVPPYLTLYGHKMTFFLRNHKQDPFPPPHVTLRTTMSYVMYTKSNHQFVYQI